MREVLISAGSHSFVALFGLAAGLLMAKRS